MRFAAIGLLVALAPLANAQSSGASARYEIMWRMRELDRTWMTHTSAEQRMRALPHVERSQQLGAPTDLRLVADALDAARYALLSDPRFGRAYEALAVSLDSRLVDVAATQFEVTFSWFYGKPYRGFFSLEGTLDGRDVAGRDFAVAHPPAYEPMVFDLDLAPVTQGDKTLKLDWGDADSQFGRREMVLSFVDRRDARLAALDKAMAALPENAPTLERDTLGALNRLLKSLASGATEETNYPGARLLAEAEQVVVAAAKGEHWYGPTKAGQFWLALMAGELLTNARVLVPTNVNSDQPIPLVIALPKAPYSENAFFDIYGDGQIVKLCEQRNWLLVSPRQNGGVDFASIGPLIDAVAAIYPVERSRVFLVGHSQGAGFAVEAAKATPTRFRGVAALAHGFALKEVSLLKDVPLFIGAGDHDEFCSNAKEVVDDLRAAGSKVATFKLYPNCERLMVVADALPDVFAWFDSLAK